MRVIRLQSNFCCSTIRLVGTEPNVTGTTVLLLLCIYIIYYIWVCIMYNISNLDRKMNINANLNTDISFYVLFVYIFFYYIHFYTIWCSCVPI